MLATRANERAAAALGVDIARMKLLGFGISAWIAGWAGVLMAYSFTVLTVDSWSPFGGITNLTLLFIGGVGSIGGALIGSALIPAGLLSSSASEGEFLRAAVAGMVMILIAVRRPDGLSSFGRPIVARIRSGAGVYAPRPPGARHDADELDLDISLD